jgi:hypothetical protein
MHSKKRPLVAQSLQAMLAQKYHKHLVDVAVIADISQHLVTLQTEAASTGTNK